MAFLPARRAHIDATRRTVDHPVLGEVLPEESCAVHCPYRPRVWRYLAVKPLNERTIAVEAAIVSLRLHVPRMAERHARHANAQFFHSARCAKNEGSGNKSPPCHRRPALAPLCEDWRVIPRHRVPQITVAARRAVATRADAVTVAETRELVARVAKTGAPLANNLICPHLQARLALVVRERHWRISEGGRGADRTRRIRRS